MRMSTHEKKKAKKGILAFGLGNYQAFWHIGNSTYALDIFLVDSIMSRFIYWWGNGIYSRCPSALFHGKDCMKMEELKIFENAGWGVRCVPHL